MWKNWEMWLARIPSPRILCPKRGSLGLPPRMARMLPPPAIRIEAGFEGNVGAFVAGDNGLGEIPQELGFWRRVIFRIPIHVPFQRDLLKAIGRVAGCAPASRQ
jgi:hypothetical protein